MLSVGLLAFLNPWLLAALAALPVLWFLLRAVPPGPKRVKFPGVRLLLGLVDPEKMPERTPWWLLLLRLAAVAAAILAFADPVLNPRQPIAGSGPVVLVLDGGWASAPDWTARQARAAELLDQAARAGRPVALLVLADPPPPEPRLDLRPAAEWAGRVRALAPSAWAPDRAAWASWVAAAGLAGADLWWLHDGLGADEGTAALTAALAASGPLTMIGPDRLALGLGPARLEDGRLRADVLRAEAGEERRVPVAAIGLDPNGRERRLAVAEAAFAAGATRATASFDLPLELRNRITRLAIASEASAGAVTLTDEAVRRRKVGLLAGAEAQEGARLVSALHFLRQALVPTAELVEAPLADMLAAAPDVIVLADIGTFAAPEREALAAWVEAGGLLVRFAGPRLAAAVPEPGEDPLLPVRLREGGRNVGGTMSWGAPRTLRAFRPGSPFFGLAVPAEVTVSRQVMAQPDPDLPDRTLAALEDGTPLVTARAVGEGRVVLFHVTANADWSNLPISGLFVQMLERLAISARAGAADPGDLAGTLWTAETVLDGYGSPGDASGLPGVPGERLATGRPGPDAPPGLYRSDDRSVALNLLGEAAELSPMPPPPAGVAVERLGTVTETPLKAHLLVLCFGLLVLDLLAALWLSGRLAGLGRRARPAGPALGLLLAAGLALGAASAARAEATGDEAAIAATRQTLLAYVVTGDDRVDSISRAGLSGLSRILAARTAIEPGEPMAVDIETAELAFFPLLYWPISEAQRTPSAAAYARLNAFLRSGGMIVFDTRDANLGAGFGAGTPNGKVLQRIAAGLDIPPLEPMPEDHVLTRTFYLLQSFPGRHAEGEVWVEAAQDAQAVEGVPFRSLNDGVTPVVIGSNDWAAAWALDADGRPLLPVGRTLGGDRQREMAFRFGVNLVMHVMTGNYKSDQVHVPALLERLGQ